MNYRLWHRHLHYGVVATRCKRSHLAHPTAYTCTCGKYSGTSHAFASSYEQCTAHHAFMGEVVTMKHHLAHKVSLNSRVG